VLSDKYSVSQKELLIDFVPGGINAKTFLSYLIPAEGATMKLIDKKGNERVDGGVADDDKVVVTSADKKATLVYHIGRLGTQYVTSPTYLAYILSTNYPIDQVVYKIDGVSGSETISMFLTKVTPATGASVAVVDKNGAVRINGDINGGDMVRVTSADGKIVVYYTFGALTGTQWMEANQIELYPNPSNGKLNVTGVQKGQRIQVYNSAGSAIIEMKVENSHEIINIDKQPAGLYMIVVSDQNGLIGKYKAIKY
jgi:formylmethanofuran dehydrogenase subunit D